jgi:hypothetical protein
MLPGVVDGMPINYPTAVESRRISSRICDIRRSGLPDVRIAAATRDLHVEVSLR